VTTTIHVGTLKDVRKVNLVVDTMPIANVPSGQEVPVGRRRTGLVTIYTDGGCKPNPGRGGYAAIVSFDGQQQEVSGGFRWTTNNRMEIMAVIAGLRALTVPSDVVIYSDSLYVVKAIESGWAATWKAEGWMRTRTEKALNSDLWEEVLALCSTHNVRFKWVRGHSGNPSNEQCDTLSRRAALMTGLPDDPGFPRPR
jgi:ribonuclease HI